MNETMKMFIGILGAGIFFSLWGMFKISAYSKVLKAKKKTVVFADLLINKSSSGIYQMIAGVALIIFSVIYLIINM